MKFVLEAQSIIKNNGIPVSFYPPGAPVPPGVGSSFTGKYVTPPGSPISADFTYARTNTGLGELEGVEGVLGLGQLCLHITTAEGDKIVIFFSYENVSTDPSVTFSVQKVKGQTTSARLNGKPVNASVRMTTSDGGQSYYTKVCLW